MKKGLPPPEALTQAFEVACQEVKSRVPDIEFSGSTGVMVFFSGQELFTANVGDSRAILCTMENRGIAETKHETRRDTGKGDYTRPQAG